MINWFVLVFILLGAVVGPFFNFPYWGLNLAIICISRSIYIYGFWLNYVKFVQKYPEDRREYHFSKMNHLSFWVKNCLLIIICVTSTYLAVFFGTYSVLVAGKYMHITASRVYEEKYKIRFNTLHFMFIILTPLFMLLFLWNFDPGLPDMIETYGFDVGLITILIKILPILLGILLYQFPGRRYANFDLKRMYRYYNKIFFGEISHLPYLRVPLIIFLIVMPSFFIIGVAGWGLPKTEHYMIEMSDGTKLATDVFFSPLVGNKPAPVIYVRSPYGMREMIPQMDTARYCSQGFHVVLQDCRGTFDSEGSRETMLFTDSYKDGNETIAWILAQPWCDGNIASSGISAMAINSYLYAGMNPKGLKSQVLWFGTPDLISDAIIEGAYREQLVNMWIEMTAPKNWRYQLYYIYNVVGNISFYDTSLEAKVVTLAEAPNTYEQVNVSALHVAGWFDIFTGGTLRAYKGYNTLGGTGARGQQKLIIGPWTHGMVFGGRQGDIEFPSSANGIGLIMDWESQILDYGLRGINSTELWKNRVAYYLMGDPADRNANYWKYASDWPLPATYTPWYIGVDANGQYLLTNNTAKLDGNKNLSYIYDPINPVITNGGGNLFSNPVGPVDQTPVEVDENGKLRSDILLFQSEVLTNPVTFEGDLKATLFIRSNCTDTDFIVKLCDVYPDGRRILLKDSALRARYRLINFTALNGPSHKPSENFLTPGQEYELTIDLVATAYRFNTGHRIGITITSSNYDRFSINPNTGGSLKDHWSNFYIANNTIVTGPGKSCIWFPQLNS